MYIELLNVDDKMARSFVCAEAVENGSFAKIKGLAKQTKAGVDLSGEVYEVEQLTDDAGELFVVIAPDYHRYDERILSGDVPQIKAKEVVRGYILHKGAVIRVQADNIDEVESVNVGDKLSPKAASYKLAKTAGTEKNILGKVIAKEKYCGKDSLVIAFI